MLAFLFTSVFPLLLLIAFSFFSNVVLHELGHAIPILCFTKGEVKVYVGSLGDSRQSLRWRIGRIEIFIKYNPLLWSRGLCKPPPETLSINKRIFYIATGPIASLLVAAICWCLLRGTEFTGIFKFAIGLIFLVSLLFILGSIYPSSKRYFTNSGQPTWNDAAQIWKLLKWKRLSPDYLKASEYCSQRKFQEAVALLDGLINKGCKDIYVYRLSVIANLNCKNFERGQYINEMIQREYEFTADDYANDGFIKSQAHQHQEAMSSYRKAIDLIPNHIYALNNLGYSLAFTDNDVEALPYFDKVISISPLFAHAHTNRGWVKMKMGLLDDGLDDVNYSLQLDPSNAEAYRNLGFYYMETGDLKKAIELFRKAKGMEEDVPLIDEYLAEVNRRQQLAKGV